MVGPPSQNPLERRVPTYSCSSCAGLPGPILSNHLRNWTAFRRFLYSHAAAKMISPLAMELATSGSLSRVTIREKASPATLPLTAQKKSLWNYLSRPLGSFACMPQFWSIAHRVQFTTCLGKVIVRVTEVTVHTLEPILRRQVPGAVDGPNFPKGTLWKVQPPYWATPRT